MSTPDHRPAPVAAPTVFGVLGGVASGKSTVARLLAGEHGVVLEADRFAQEALDSEEVQQKLRAAFGERVIGADGRTDRKVLADLAFGEPERRRRLEDWIHPLVRERIHAGIAEARALGRDPIVLDVPLLLEHDEQHGFAGRCDHLVFVEAPVEERDRRAVAHRKWRPGEIQRREAVQLPLHEKRARAHFVVQNAGTPAELEAQVREILTAVGRT